MIVQRLTSQVFQKVVREYFADSPMGVSPFPALRRPAGEEAQEELRERFGGFLEPSYRDFLRVTDGMEGTPVVILGCSDWGPGGLGEKAKSYKDELEGTGTPQDVGVPEETLFFPVAINEDASDGIFMGDFSTSGEYRFWWVGRGSSRFFASFYDVLAYTNDESAYDPVETLD